MRLSLGSLAAAAIAEGDPLPPEDRVPARRMHSLELLFRSQRPKLLRFLARRTTNDDAQDLVQQAFTRLAGLDEDRMSAINCPEAYLHRTATNLLANEAKTARNRSLHLADSVELVAADQFEALEARDMLRRLEAAMLKLRPRTREIFMAHRIDGFSYVEIAQQTGLSIKGVESQMSRAIAQLDRLLESR